MKRSKGRGSTVVELVIVVAVVAVVATVLVPSFTQIVSAAQKSRDLILIRNDLYEDADVS